jgi:hypothetical protein
VSGSTAAVHHFRRKIRYWKNRDEVIAAVRERSATTELSKYVPVIESPSSTALGEYLPSLIAVRDLLESGHFLCRSLFSDSGITDDRFEMSEIEANYRIFNEQTGVAIGFHEIAEVRYGRDRRKVANLVVEVISAAVTTIEERTRLRIADQREHYYNIMRAFYPLR